MKKTPQVAPVLTVEEKIARNLEITKHELQSSIKSSRETIAKFVGDIQKESPWEVANAFVWSRGAAEAAACMAVSSQALQILTEQGVNGLAEYATAKALSSARNPEFSTSPTSNMMSLYTGSAWARLAQDLSYRVSAE